MRKNKNKYKLKSFVDELYVSTYNSLEKKKMLRKK